jgi:hypothetical protein
MFVIFLVEAVIYFVEGGFRRVFLPLERGRVKGKERKRSR